jgi:hypothetical protein
MTQRKHHRRPQLTGDDAHALLRITWEWIIDANNGLGVDTGDLASRLEREGYTCPEGLDDE